MSETSETQTLTQEDQAKLLQYLASAQQSQEPEEPTEEPKTAFEKYLTRQKARAESDKTSHDNAQTTYANRRQSAQGNPWTALYAEIRNTLERSIRGVGGLYKGLARAVQDAEPVAKAAGTYAENKAEYRKLYQETKKGIERGEEFTQRKKEIADLEDEKIISKQKFENFKAGEWCPSYPTIEKELLKLARKLTSELEHKEKKAKRKYNRELRQTARTKTREAYQKQAQEKAYEAARKGLECKLKPEQLAEIIVKRKQGEGKRKERLSEMVQAIVEGYEPEELEEIYGKIPEEEMEIIQARARRIKSDFIAKSILDGMPLEQATSLYGEPAEKYKPLIEELERRRKQNENIGNFNKWAQGIENGWSPDYLADIYGDEISPKLEDILAKLYAGKIEKEAREEREKRDERRERNMMMYMMMKEKFGFKDENIEDFFTKHTEEQKKAKEAEERKRKNKEHFAKNKGETSENQEEKETPIEVKFTRTDTP